MGKAKNVRSVPCWVTDVTHDPFYETYQRLLASEWRTHSRELEEWRKQLEVGHSHPRDITSVCTPVSEGEAVHRV